MSSVYKHKQTGWAIIIASTAVLLLLFHFLRQGEAPTWILVFVILLFVLVLVVFSSLTVEIRDGRLLARLGPGLPIKNVPLEEIEAVHVVRDALWLGLGWGIRWTTRGVLFNVSGTGAVEILLRSGKSFLLGTDEPEVLSGAIEEAVPAP